MIAALKLRLCQSVLPARLTDSTCENKSLWSYTVQTETKT